MCGFWEAVPKTINQENKPEVNIQPNNNANQPEQINQPEVRDVPTLHV